MARNKARCSTLTGSYESRMRSICTATASRCSTPNCLSCSNLSRCKFALPYMSYLYDTDFSFSESRDGQTVLMLECTDLVLQRLEVIDSRVSRILGETVSIQPRRRLDVPPPIENLLESTAIAKYGSSTRIPMAQGVDEVIFYLDRAKQWHTRRQSSQPGEATRASKWANLLRAYWLLQATKASEDYQAAATTISVAEFERQFPRLGMTVRRFFVKLEDVSASTLAAVKKQPN